MGDEQLKRGAVKYPNGHVWLVFVSAMDLMLTWLILNLGGREVNPLAEWILETGGFPAMIAFKFGVVVFVICVCEFIGRHRWQTGRTLIWVAVGLSALPIVVALAQLVLVPP